MPNLSVSIPNRSAQNVSCIGMTIYDPISHVGGLLHAMLPDSALDPGKAKCTGIPTCSSGSECPIDRSGCESGRAVAMSIS